MTEFENRFAEVQRKSREARARLDARQQTKAAAEQERADALREQRESPYSEWDSTPPDSTPKKK
jgi:hypothetical protein